MIRLPISRPCQFFRHLTLGSTLACLFIGLSANADNLATSTVEQEILDRSVMRIVHDIQSSDAMQTAQEAKDQINGLVIQIEKSPLLQEKSSLCMSLLRLNDEELALFDSELDEIIESKALNSCALQIRARIENHWVAQISGLPEPYGFFKPAGRSFPTFQVVEKFYSADNPSEYSGSRATEGFEDKQLMLTFDDGPNDKATPSILDILRDRGAKATFFSLGRNAHRYPKVLQRVGAEGHAIGSHSCFHPSLGTWIGKEKTFDECPTFYKQKKKIWTIEDSFNEILNGHAYVFMNLGWIDPFFRFPHGDSNDEMKTYLKENGIHSFRWNIDSYDWQSTNIMGIVQNTLNKIKSQNDRGIVLFHDTLKQTTLALPIILDQLALEGYTLVLPVLDQPDLRFENVPLIESHPQRINIEKRANAIRYKELLKRTR